MSGAILLLDLGNSRVKWALSEAGEWLAEGASQYDRLDNLFLEWDRFQPPRKVLGCNVAGEDRIVPITQYWRKRNVPLNWIHSREAFSGVSNLYDKPEQLGTDRWAALVGAWSRAKGACLVVSAGTAFTVDTLNQQGEFISGFILPGKRLMHQSLVSGTHALDDIPGNITDFPRNTADGMASGIALALNSTVQMSFQHMASLKNPSPLCIITGGDAEWLSKQLPFSVIIAPKLVLEGLLIMADGVDQA